MPQATYKGKVKDPNTLHLAPITSYEVSTCYLKMLPCYLRMLP